MSYHLKWTDPAVAGKAEIEVPVASVVHNKASLEFTGKGAANYGTLQQENLMHLLENFASGTAPNAPTIGQIWYDTTNTILRLCTGASPTVWKSLAGIQVTNIGEVPVSPAVGDMWFERAGSSSGILYVYTGLGRYPVSGTVIGGWNQVWPQIDFVAGREEYNAALELLNQLMGPTSVGGSAALGKSVTNLTNLTGLDTNLVTKYAARTPLDANVLSPTNAPTTELLIDPNSNDWDTLLAAAKYAISRLDVPPDYVDDISPVPFISDGRQAPSSLLALNPADVRYPSLERRSGRRFGIATLSRLYSETMNVLTTAVQNRYSLKGINGNTGANVSFGTNTTVVAHAQFSGAVGGATTANIALRFQFPTLEARNTFLNSGGAIQITMNHTGGASPGDTSLRALFDQRGVLRLNADKSRVFGSALPLTLSIAPATTGLKAATVGGVTLTTQTVGASNYVVSATIPTDTTLVVNIVVTSSSLTGTLSFKYEVVKDVETYQAPALTNVYGSPNAYVVGDKTGSSFLV